MLNLTRQDISQFYALREKVPVILSWIDDTLDAYRRQTVRLKSLQPKRLAEYFSQHTLDSAKVIPVELIPKPPLAQWGMKGFEDFEARPIQAITYRDSFFIQRDKLFDEGLHCHELVHVVQWKYLGFEQFLLLYGFQLDQLGYADHPFEAMARKHAEAFLAGVAPYRIETAIVDELESYF